MGSTADGFSALSKRKNALFEGRRFRCVRTCLVFRLKLSPRVSGTHNNNNNSNRLYFHLVECGEKDKNLLGAA